MEMASDVRSQLQTLRIPKDQRPGAAVPARPGGRGATKVLVTILVLALLAAGAYFGRGRIAGLLGGSASAAEVRLLSVVRQREPAAASVLTATGKIVSDHKVQVTTKVSGQIVALYFEQGDRVKKGQVLARVEDVIYRTRRDEAAARLEKSKAHLAFQKLNFARIEVLHKEGSAPDIEHADGRRMLQEAEAQVAADQASLDYAQKALTDCEVVAPIDGVILERNVEVGDFVAAEGGLGANANAQFGTIADMNAVRVEVDVSELDINRIQKGMPCTVTPDAYKDRRYRGHVLWIDPGANYAKATVQVKVRVENPDDHLRYEGSAQVVFEPQHEAARPPAATQQAPTIWIPATACVRDPAGGTAKVYVVADGRLRQTSVKLGRQSGNQLEVLAGLAEGQTIAAEGLDRLKDGQRVRS
jgi:RND family efflux transporter MFP subunit